MLREVTQIWLLAILMLTGLHSRGDALPGQPRPSGLVLDLPVTNGLIRWWPNLFDARDEITGQEGVVMGVLPPVETGADDGTEFGKRTAWVQLQPAITNEVFTLSFWVRLHMASWHTRLLGQEADEGEWLFQFFGGEQAFPYFIGPHNFQEVDRTEHVILSPEAWRHVAIARRRDGTSIVWVDGVRAPLSRADCLIPGRREAAG